MCGAHLVLSPAQPEDEPMKMLALCNFVRLPFSLKNTWKHSMTHKDQRFQLLLLYWLCSRGCRMTGCCFFPTSKNVAWRRSRPFQNKASCLAPTISCVLMYLEKTLMVAKRHELSGVLLISWSFSLALPDPQQKVWKLFLTLCSTRASSHSSESPECMSSRHFCLH